MKIAVFGVGYVGLSLSVLLSSRHEVVAVDVVPEKVRMLNERISPLQDEYIEKYFAEAKAGERELNLTATMDAEEALKGAKFVIIATPTNYDTERNFFDTSSVEDVIEKAIKFGEPDVTIVIKSTIPVGYVESVREKFGIKTIFFSPEFMREGRALYDNLYPSRIIVGDMTAAAREFAEILKEASLEPNVPVLFMNSTEAEAVKLFANTYLALRVAYFNELDTYAVTKGLDARSIIEGVSLDPRIGAHYNNPSFGYGGYCLPKDTKQLLANYRDVPQNLIEAIVKSNETRKRFIATKVLEQKPKMVGVYRLTMKSNSDNFRSSAIQDIISELVTAGVDVLVYEPSYEGPEFLGAMVTSDLDSLKENASVILANRMVSELSDVADKVMTRDIFARD